MRVVPVGAEECGSLDSSTTITSWSWRGRAGLESESESEPDDDDDDELLLLLGDLLRRCGGPGNGASFLASSAPPVSLGCLLSVPCSARCPFRALTGARTERQGPRIKEQRRRRQPANTGGNKCWHAEGWRGGRELRSAEESADSLNSRDGQEEESQEEPQ